MGFVSRAGYKLDFALSRFGIDVAGMVCADLGCSTGGFTDCLLQRKAEKVYAVDTGYGVLDYSLRTNPGVVVLERTNALHVTLPEAVDFVSIDLGWTSQALILPHALTLLSPGGRIVSLLKPYYEAKQAHLSDSEADVVAKKCIVDLKNHGIPVTDIITSPLLGEKGKNREYLFMVYYPDGASISSSG